jgi:hypothetical protein
MPLESTDPKGRYWEETSLPPIGSLAPGIYTNPTIRVDEYGRVTQATSNPITGNINALDEGVNVPGGPFGVVNFTGVGVVASDLGGGVLEVNVPGGGSGVALEDEGSLIIGGPHSILNFVGDDVFVVNVGLNRADITIQSANVQRYRQAAIDTTATIPLGVPIQTNGIPRRVVVTINTPYDPGATIEVEDGLGTTIMPTTAVNPQLAGSYEFELPGNTTTVGAGGEQINVIVGGGPAAGDGVAEIFYLTA